MRCHHRASHHIQQQQMQQQQQQQQHPLTPPSSTSHSSRDVSPVLSDHHPISPPTSTYSDDNWMYSGVSPSTAMSDISSSTYNNNTNAAAAVAAVAASSALQQQQQTQLVQPNNTFVTQTMENSFGPDHIINDLFFPMDIDSKPSAEYSIGKAPFDYK